jgi:hypothetical protein
MGMPVMPARKVVQPRRNKSQWKPAGFLRGNCLAWAVRLLTFFSELVLFVEEK